MQIPTAQEMIAHLALEPLPKEGGWYRRKFTSPHNTIIPEGPWAVPKATASAIYYLVTPESFSTLHRLPNTEIFFHLHGDSCEQLQITPDGTRRILPIGKSLPNEQPMLIVEGQTWQSLRLKKASQSLGWALFAVVVTPAFDWQDYESAPSSLQSWTEDTP